MGLILICAVLFVGFTFASYGAIKRGIRLKNKVKTSV